MSNAMYKDAKEWLADMVDLESITAKELLSFVLCEVSADDIERWFGVNMDDDSDNPGAGMEYCSECRTDVDHTDYDYDLDMCKTCAAALDEDEPEEEGEEENEEEIATWFEILTEWPFDLLRRSVHLYAGWNCATGDMDYYPWFDSNTYSAQ